MVFKMWKKYLVLTKPGIIFGNVVTAMGGFFLASKDTFHVLHFLSMVIGLGLIIASACVFNNCRDIDIDSKMKRTEKRALVTGKIDIKKAIIFGCILLLLGSALLITMTNLYATISALLGFIVYVLIYTPIKKRSVHGTLVGSTAESCQFDLASLLLFTIVAVWQMPHFYAISLFRISEYERANIPVLPLVKGVDQTKKQMLYYTLCFAVVSLLPTYFGYTSKTYLYIAIGCSLLWIYNCIKGFNHRCYIPWARTMFKSSIIVITILSFSLYI
jgi:protoheme IX farnesyltransferase